MWPGVSDSDETGAGVARGMFSPGGAVDGRMHSVGLGGLLKLFTGDSVSP